jgi:hypothetical protein
LSQVLDEDPRLGTIERFPSVLHARASLVYDMKAETLQKALVHSLSGLQESIRAIQLSLSDQPGYHDGTVGFRVGVGNQDGFDILDVHAEDRVLRRIIGQGVFQMLDFSLEIQYKVKGSGRHRVQRDRYLARMSFQPERAEVLIHHLKGLRRIQPDELVRFLLSITNAELAKRGYGEVELETLESD